MGAGPVGASRIDQQLEIRDKCRHPTGTFTSFPLTALGDSIPARFEYQVSQHPDRVAVRTRNEALSYQQLNRLANRIARRVLQELGDSNEPVALLMDKGPGLI